MDNLIHSLGDPQKKLQKVPLNLRSLWKKQIINHTFQAPIPHIEILHSHRNVLREEREGSLGFGAHPHLF